MTSIHSEPGFQGSETSGCHVIFYRLGADGDAVTVSSGAGDIGGVSQTDSKPSLISVQTQKMMGTAGAVSFNIKCPLSTNFFDYLMDDDWFDVVFTRHGKQWHVMRGSVDEVRCDTVVGGTGATTRMFTVTGRDFQKIFDSTPIWFDIYSGENAFGSAVMRVFNDDGTVSPAVNTTVRAFLQGFLNVIAEQGQANYALPTSLPNNPSSGRFIDAVSILDADFTNTPARFAATKNFLPPNGMAWQLAAQWSDPIFCELYTDVLDTNYDAGPAPDGLSPQASNMAVVFRDRPFLYVDPIAGPYPGLSSPWFQLPLYEVARQTVLSTSLGRNGYERYNAIYCNQQVALELLGEQMVTMTGGIWNIQQLLYHGMRRFDVVSLYSYNTVPALLAQRAKVRDWHAPNPYLFNGTVAFGRGLPDLKIGTRLRIKGSTNLDDQTFYVEGVTHSWNLTNGMRTSATVTRGFTGTDGQLINMVQAAASGFKTQPEGSPGATPTSPINGT